jgi:hypothetical protein
VKKQNQADRFANSILDGYQNHSDYLAIVTNFMDQPNVSREVIIRDRAMFTLSHSSVQRSEIIRRLEFADMGLLYPDRQGLHRCPVSVFVSNNGKTNVVGRKDNFAVMRHRDVRTCGTFRF